MRKNNTNKQPHIFFDAEGTIYVTKKNHHYKDFWEGKRTIKEAKRIFKLDKNMQKIMEQLSSWNIPMYLVSKHDHEDLLLDLLEYFDVKKYFQEILVNGDKGERIKDLAVQQKIPLSQCIMLGDRYELDIEPVLKAGAMAFLVQREYNSHYTGPNVTDRQMFLDLVQEQMKENQL
jgi:FMN phosphatase YigB (HAD superfamily)